MKQPSRRSEHEGFKPATKDGKPVPVYGIIEVYYHLPRTVFLSDIDRKIQSSPLPSFLKSSEPLTSQVWRTLSWPSERRLPDSARDSRQLAERKNS
jgi:hypothetical protein